MDTSDLMRRLLEKKGNGELQQGKGSGLGGIAGAFASTAGTDWPSNFVNIDLVISFPLSLSRHAMAHFADRFDGLGFQWVLV